ncbi:hypothetical protein RRG08_054311 [Elysia crispata]|uniref:Uncharacterized protein n=1 Tax=Elysia crispata TaxID=231223 RepID=A0AAE0YR99_9GAST|nr:hypothetical protein RRG08_054311 [Elysia crispata]
MGERGWGGIDTSIVVIAELSGNESLRKTKRINLRRTNSRRAEVDNDRLSLRMCEQETADNAGTNLYKPLHKSIYHTQTENSNDGNAVFMMFTNPVALSVRNKRFWHNQVPEIFNIRRSPTVAMNQSRLLLLAVFCVLASESAVANDPASFVKRKIARQSSRSNQYPFDKIAIDSIDTAALDQLLSELVEKRSFDPLGSGFISKRPFDPLGSGFISKRPFDPLGSGFISKRPFDPLGSGFISKRPFDPLGSGFISKRNFDTVGSGFIKGKRPFDKVGSGFIKGKRPFDPVGSGFIKGKRQFDSLGSGFIKGKRQFDPLGSGFIKSKRSFDQDQYWLSDIENEDGQNLYWK